MKGERDGSPVDAALPFARSTLRRVHFVLPECPTVNLLTIGGFRMADSPGNESGEGLSLKTIR